ncbi:hypothetical protein ACE3MZ_09700 [Paenibacillus sp. WLX1005]|uniref:hypothetical protein n=1 Tax=Paenibacillus sp. WLX1005 TaxID=3243766 RepID=UPI00398409D9
MITNTKKIRGWKRKVKQIEEWKQRYIKLDMDYITSYQRDYVKLWIDPFYRLDRRNPPGWYARLLLAAMMEVYYSWDDQMKQLQEPYYLKIWLYAPHFINSQIVVACRDQLHFYDHTFEKATDKAKLSHHYAMVPGINDFQWETCIDTAYESLLDLQRDVEMNLRQPSDILHIQHKAYHAESVISAGQADTLYWIKDGIVWVGALEVES